MMKDNSQNNSKIIYKIETAFSRLIGPLSIMKELKSYESSKEEINDILNIVIKWGVKFQINQNLSFINSDEILSIYNRLDSLKDKYLFDINLGNENELSDEVVIWIYELMELRKKQIEEGL